MNTYTTNKVFNPSQLSYELGKVALNVNGPDEYGNITIFSMLSNDVLSNALKAHIYNFEWINPEPVIETPQEIQYKLTLAKLEKLGLTVEDLSALGLGG